MSFIKAILVGHVINKAKNGIITLNCDGQILQIAARLITSCDRYYKVR